MATPSTNMNSLMKFLDLLYSPEFAQMTGTFDPLALVDDSQNEVDMPLARAYMNSKNEDVARIFSGIVAGEYDPISAKQELAGLDLGGLDTGPLYNAVDNVFKEVLNASSGSTSGTSGKKSKKDEYQKAGLPNPLQSYSQMPEFAPIGKVATQKIAESQKQKVLYDKAISALTSSDTTDDGDIPSWISRSLGEQGQNRDAVLQTMKNRSGYQGNLQNAYVEGNAALLDKSGRTPFNDALIKRALLAKQMFGQ